MQCPECGRNCVPVSLRTMLHQVCAPENRYIAGGDYAYCANRDCHIGYFSASNRIPKSSLRAFQPGQRKMLCHCFDISESAWRTALAAGRAVAMKDFVVQQTKAGLCACETRNPSGRCCLAFFNKWRTPMITESTITCPVCGHRKKEIMPDDTCQWFYECEQCHALLKPKDGDCCVFCSYGDAPCPPVQKRTSSV